MDEYVQWWNPENDCSDDDNVFMIAIEINAVVEKLRECHNNNVMTMRSSDRSISVRSYAFCY